MKCLGKKKDGSLCDYSQEDTFEFCPDCGYGTKPEASRFVIKCPGKENPCGSELTSDDKFCRKCGWKIDPTLFQTALRKCRGRSEDGSLCKAYIKEDDNFCNKCGYNITTVVNDHNVPEKDNVLCTSPNKSDSLKVTDVNVTERSVEQSEDGSGNEGQTDSVSQPESTDTDSTERITDSPREARDEDAGGTNEDEEKGRKHDENVTERSVEQSEGGSGNDGSKEEDSFQKEKDLSTEGNQHEGQQMQIDSGSQTDSSVTDSTQQITGDDSKTDSARESRDQDAGGTNEDEEKGRNLDENVTERLVEQSEVCSGNDGSKEEDSFQPETDLSAEGTHNEGPMDSGSQPESTVADSRTDSPREPGDEDSNGTNEDVEKTTNHDDNVARDGSSVDEAPDTGTPEEVTVPTATVNRTNSSNSQHGANNSGKQDTFEGDSNSQNQDAVTRSKSQKKTGNGKAEEKQKTKDTNKNKSTGKKTNSNAGARGREPDPKHHEFKVIFHAVISKDFKVKPEKDEVYVVIGCEPLGGWNGKKWKMTHVGCLQGYHEYSCKVTMTKDIRNGGFEYKYKVVSDARKDPFESVCFGKKKNGIANRKFIVPKQRRQITDPLHQYDGLVYPKQNDGFFKSLFGGGGSQGRIVDDMKTVLNIFLPPDKIISTIKKQVPEETETAEALLQTLTDIFSGLSLQLVDINNSNEVRQEVWLIRNEPRTF